MKGTASHTRRAMNMNIFFIFSSNVEVHLRRTMCDVRCNALFAHILLAVWLLTPKIQFFLFLPPNQAASAARRHLHIFCANVSVHRRRLVRRTVERLVGFHFHRPFLASLSKIVSAGFVPFVLLWWKVHCARGCQYISCIQRQRSPSRRLRRVRWNALFNAFIFPPAG